MDKPAANISQIKKYLSGELDAKAMHRLEREAQDDSFLMDALEGYETAGKDQQLNLDLLTERLDSRIRKKERRIIPWTMISIAAGVAGFMIVVGLLYRAHDNNSITTPSTAQVPAKTPPRADTVSSLAPAIAIDRRDVAVWKPVVGSSRSVVAANSKTAPVKQFATEPRAVEVAPELTGNTAPKDSVAMADKIMAIIAKQKDSAVMPLTVVIKKRPMSQVLQSKVDGVTTSESKSENNAYKLNTLNVPAAEAGYLAGVVVNRAGMPMPGVTVKVAGKPEVTQTDAKGGFSLPSKSNKETLDFSYLGYESKKLSAKSRDSLKVEMNENTSSLNEVVIIPSDAKAQSARPVNGWKAFDSYIKQHAVLPPGTKTGVVKLKFTINPDGTISNIIVLKGLTPAADEQALSILRNGGKWAGRTDGKPETVIKDIVFTIQKP